MQIDLNPIATIPEPSPAFWQRWGGYLIGAAVLVVVAAVLWYLLAGTASTRREVPATPMLMLPPPPPPPPEPEKLPEPEKVKPEVVEPKVEPTPVEQPKPAEDTPNPAKDLSDPVTMDASGQAGTDAFGIGAGKGGGMSGAGGAGNATYGRYFGYVLQQALSRDERVRRLAFLMQVNVWLDAGGRLTRVELVRGSGNAETDQAVLAALRAVEKVDERPPASLQFPQRVTVQGRRPTS